MLSSKLLSQIKCCIRCSLRLSGHMLRNAFSVDHDREEMISILAHHLDEKSIIDDLWKQSKTDSAAICSLCLGILQDHNLKECVEKITIKMRQENYDSETFAINAMIPNAINIRQKSLSLFATENASNHDGSKLELKNMISVKEAFKYGLSSKIEEVTGKKLDVQSLLRVTIVMKYKDETEEVSKLPTELPESNSRKRKYNGNSIAPSISLLQKSLDKLETVDSMKKYYPCPPSAPTESCSVNEISCYQESIFVGGRYNKFSRDLSQSPWIIDGVRKTETSVQELACKHIQDYFRADGIKFISAGREDVDVKMLGAGRPFAIELLNARTTHANRDELEKLEREINASTELIAVRKLTMVSRNDMTLLKEGEESKIKFYSAIIYVKDGVSDEKLEELCSYKDLVLAQKTPLRVLHRRPLAVRMKTIHTMHAKRIDDNHFKLALSTQAGTYIKEFVHGDFRRTKPSLGTLLETETDILELDVEEVQLDWPPASYSDVCEEKVVN